MPYITPAIRAAYEDPRLDIFPTNSGELNYVLTKLCDEYLKRNGLTYQHINDTIGALECAKLELYRRVAAPYEDKKIQQNGEVYTCDTTSRGR